MHSAEWVQVTKLNVLERYEENVLGNSCKGSNFVLHSKLISL